jgi:hypothetical protein
VTDLLRRVWSVGPSVVSMANGEREQVTEGVGGVQQVNEGESALQARDELAKLQRELKVFTDRKNRRWTRGAKFAQVVRNVCAQRVGPVDGPRAGSMRPISVRHAGGNDEEVAFANGVEMAFDFAPAAAFHAVNENGFFRALRTTAQVTSGPWKVSSARREQALQERVFAQRAIQHARRHNDAALAIEARSLFKDAFHGGRVEGDGEIGKGERLKVEDLKSLGREVKAKPKSKSDQRTHFSSLNTNHQNQIVPSAPHTVAPMKFACGLMLQSHAPRNEPVVTMQSRIK